MSAQSQMRHDEVLSQNRSHLIHGIGCDHLTACEVDLAHNRLEQMKEEALYRLTPRYVEALVKDMDEIIRALTSGQPFDRCLELRVEALSKALASLQKGLTMAVQCLSEGRQA